MYVKAKKSLGQHFLTDLSVAEKIVASIYREGEAPSNLLEVGPGTGVLTQFLLKESSLNLKLVELDSRSVEYLHNHYPNLGDRLIEGDFLKLDLSELFSQNYMVIGNFPYNISSQILFKVLDHKDKIESVVGMFQKEVARRIASPPGSREYGILSVLLQAWYSVEYLFEVGSNSFSPPPKVESAVIRIVRNSRTQLHCNSDLFKRVVKAAFGMRRKKISNAIKPLYSHKKDKANLLKESPLMDKRAEQLSVEQFIELTKLIELL
ncbi:MAG: 16S rRNA (adenine(1518)-N(6)/adenine(1519)-N(6))-dimethyltransferase RsmA [Bacteroidales bacterium]